MGDALSAVESLYFALQSNLNDALAACETEEQRVEIRTKYVQARQNYWDCIDRTFHEDDPAVQSLVTQAKAVCSEIQKMDEYLGDIAKVLSIVTKAVDIGSQIAAKVITL